MSRDFFVRLSQKRKYRKITGKEIQLIARAFDENRLEIECWKHYVKNMLTNNEMRNTNYLWTQKNNLLASACKSNILISVYNSNAKTCIL